jgi:hypothetical protein
VHEREGNVLYLPVLDPSASVIVRAHLEALTAPPVVLYIGPDQILPVTSFIGAILGFLLMFWQKLVGLTRKVRARFTRGAESRHTESSV